MERSKFLLFFFIVLFFLWLICRCTRYIIFNTGTVAFWQHIWNALHKPTMTGTQYDAQSDWHFSHSTNSPMNLYLCQVCGTKFYILPSNNCLEPLLLWITFLSSFISSNITLPFISFGTEFYCCKSGSTQVTRGAPSQAVAQVWTLKHCQGQFFIIRVSDQQVQMNLAFPILS